MMESQETNNPQAETSATNPTSEQNPSAQGANPNGENSEGYSDTAPDAQAQKELQGDGTDKESSATFEQLECSKNSPPTLEEDGDSGRISETSEPADEKIKPLPNKKEIGLLGMLGMSQSNDKISNDLREVYRWLAQSYNERPHRQIRYEDIPCNGVRIKAALDLIERLQRNCESLQNKLDTRQSSETTYYKQEVQRLNNQNEQLDQELKAVQQERETLQKKLADTESSRDRLLAETASLKRNTGTHYDGTSARPQHHVLTGEYKTLKEQHLDPLATSLFTFMAALDPELKQQRREKLNDIRAAISDTVLIGGQAIMRGESTASVELPSGILDDLLGVLCQRLQLNNQDISPETTELLNKAANLAQGKVQYPAPGQWEKQDFLDASAELSARLYQVLSLERTSLSQELQEATPKAIQNALRFLERAALADPPASLSLYNEDTPFRSDYHEAAKGLDDEGTVIKTIYPVYLVNGEAKVKAVVLTKPSGEMSPGALPPNPITNAPETTPTDITGDTREQIRLKTKRESLIKVVKKKWFEVQHSLDKTGETRLTEKLLKLDQIDLIEELLENEIPKGPITLEQFEKKVDEMLAAFYSQ
ncbi:hypothetical protein [Kamptonema formosum]|uniref:hypothetical protein n=1 Tax=Kamptonema formosum TaxID=331992 RepID=UPI000348AC88|nr:hypothetical protein [Oscillatoria sp. PCC 10802]